MDYTLFTGLSHIGVIEAKRRDPDRRSWGEFWVVFAFASNGRPETDPFA